jgi:hypothetical protein
MKYDHHKYPLEVAIGQVGRGSGSSRVGLGQFDSVRLSGHGSSRFRSDRVSGLLV